MARPWVHAVRDLPASFWAMESLLREYPISSAEGLALSWVGTGRLIFTMDYSDEDFEAVAARVLAAAAKMAEITAQIEDSGEVQDVVAGLEAQYDSYHRPLVEDAEALPLAEEKDLPTGEELGAEFERFLAGLDKPNDPGE